MTRTLTSLLIALFVGLAAVASPAQAQNKRPSDTFYLKFGVGLSDYTGDFADPFEGFSNGDGFPYMWQGELGYQVSSSFGIGAMYQAGRYPLSSNNVSGSDPDRLTAAALLGRYTFGADTWTAAPYIDAGANLSFGGNSIGGGPSVGAGVDIALNDWASLYVESRTHLTFGDNAVDGATGGSSFDALSEVLGIGVKMNFQRAATPPRVLALDGPTEVKAGESVTYTASINEGEATSPLTYRWNFGDGSTGSGMTAEHTYREAGTYTVQFTASNKAGTASQTRTVEVVAPQPARIVSVNANPTRVDEGESVSFSVNAQGDSPISYAWTFGDGSSGSGASPSHTYEEPGTYTAEVTASNDAGEGSQTITVTVERALPSICMSTSELNSTYFSRNSSTLTDESKKALKENLEILNKCPNLTVRVEGFAAPGERNAEQLSEDRVEAVTEFYEEGGVSSDRVMSEAQGAPEGVTTKKGGTQQYRRVDSIPQREQ
ncbi:MAG: PKD domain-containing protein [Candidatus Bipolaricaulia bacterium]